MILALFKTEEGACFYSKVYNETMKKALELIELEKSKFMDVGRIEVEVKRLPPKKKQSKNTPK